MVIHSFVYHMFTYYVLGIVLGARNIVVSRMGTHSGVRELTFFVGKINTNTKENKLFARKTNVQSLFLSL